VDGGTRVPKILVADDNSNVQRTVALALSDLGIEVVAVNNGEAAVRKLNEISPDLILADIFMPVRNGYEVCEHVKQSPRFSTTPVVLLVGAFDPFDEREAQRVGADGILKKPFVPPDPLIAMVKTLLDRVTAAQPVMSTVSKSPAVTTQRSIAAAQSKVLPASEKREEEPLDQNLGGSTRLAFGDGERPLAFGEFFEVSPTKPMLKPINVASVQDEPQEELTVTSKRDAALGDPSFWRNENEEVEGEIAPSATSDRAPALVEHPWEKALPPEPVHVVGIQTPIPEESFELVREATDDTLNSTADSAPVVLDAAAQADLTVNASKPADLAANPLEWMASAPPQLPVTEAAIPEAEITQALEAVAEPEQPEERPLAAEKWSDLSGDTVPSTTPDLVAALATSTMPETDSVATKSGTSTPQPTDSPAAKPPAPQIVQAPGVAPPTPTAILIPEDPDPSLVEAVVKRVLEKMSPQVVEIITQEFLRPVVQALVKREIDKH
jgi:CheY-like chemotaxis protein